MTCMHRRERRRCLTIDRLFRAIGIVGSLALVAFALGYVVHVAHLLIDRLERKAKKP